VCEIVSTIALSLCTVVEDGSESIEGCAANRVSDILVPMSADKIGYISIISCNINILHRMLCE